jgi:uncharacterized protein YndB with AHSA1/START domain
MSAVDFIETVSIEAPPDAVWQAIVDPNLASKYYLVPLSAIELTPGGRISYGTAEETLITGEIENFEPGVRLRHTFRFSRAILGTADDPMTTVTYLLEPSAHGTTLTLIHSGFPRENQTYTNIAEGWPAILHGLKNLLEKK